MQTTTRNAGLPDLIGLLTSNHARKVDIVAPATTIISREGLIHVQGAEQEITLDGVTATDGIYRPTAVFDGGIAAKLGVPPAYLRRLRTERPDLYDANVNGWLHGRRPLRNLDAEVIREAVPADPRSFLVRAYRDDDGGVGVARAFLSNGFRIMDDFDVLTAVLDGVKDAGVAVDVTGCDLTDYRMHVRIDAPEIRTLAPELLRGYRSPFTGQSGDANPVVFAGLAVSNSEVGGGKFSIVPRVVIQVCKNGQTITRDAMTQTHLGARLEDGLVQWSDNTQEKNLELIKAKASDAVRTFLSPGYLEAAVAGITAKAVTPLVDPTRTIETVAKRLQFTEEQRAGILSHFVAGGQLTAGGVMQAVTALAQSDGHDGDVQADLESKALDVLDAAVAAA